MVINKDQILKYSIGVNIALLILCVCLWHKPAKIVTQTKTVTQTVQVKGETKTQIEYKDRIVDRVVEKITAGTTIIITEKSTDTGKVDTNVQKQDTTKTDTTSVSTKTETFTTTRWFTAGGYWRFDSQSPGVLVGLNIWDITPFVMGDYSVLHNQFSYSAGVQIKF
jgi:hypothetical protein